MTNGSPELLQGLAAVDRDAILALASRSCALVTLEENARLGMARVAGSDDRSPESSACTPRSAPAASLPTRPCPPAAHPRWCGACFCR